MDYEKLLDKAKAELPEDVKETERFEIPKVRGQVEGSKTIISNFVQIANELGRKPKHLLKYVLRELATPGEIVKDRVVFGSKVAASRVNDAIKAYSDEFVFCKECGKPETTMTKEGDIYIIKCQACGARQSMYAKI
ncbi:translation initiation factor IF-2 subunit beta [Nanoarchaeota archaeon]